MKEQKYYQTWKRMIEKQFEFTGDTWDDVVQCSTSMENIESRFCEDQYEWDWVVVFKDVDDGSVDKLNWKTREEDDTDARKDILESFNRMFNYSRKNKEIVCIERVTERLPYDGVDFRLWTEKFVYFPHTYDGMLSVEYVLRNPTEMCEENENLFEPIGC